MQRRLHRAVPLCRTGLHGATVGARRKPGEHAAGEEVARRLPESSAQPGESRSAEGGRLDEIRTSYGHTQDVRLELHQPVVRSRPAVDEETREFQLLIGAA